MTERQFMRLIEKAAIRNRERDEIERKHGNAAPPDCPIDVHVATALEALESGMRAPSTDCLAEAYDLLRTALKRLRDGQTAGIAVITKTGPFAGKLLKLPDSTN